MITAQPVIRITLLAATLLAGFFGIAPARGSAQPSGPQCLRQPNPQPPPDGGVVFARPLDGGSSKPNVVVIPAGTSWDTTACGGSAQGAEEVMTHPTSIAVAPGAAVWLQDQPAGLVAAWGAKNVGNSDPAPVLFPGRSDWTTTSATVADPETVLNLFNSCRGCTLPGIDFEPTQAIIPTIAYEGDVSGADLTGATLHKTFGGWNFNGTNLSGVTFVDASLTGAALNRTVVDGTVFDGSDLRGAHLEGLGYAVPPSFAGVRVGPFNGICTVFKDMNLINAGLTPVKPDPGCENTPLLPGSAAPLSLIKLLLERYHAGVDLANARFVADARDRTDLAAGDLHGANLDGVSFLGFPADLSGTNFDGASLQHTSFELADLSRATFHDVHATRASFEDARLDGASFAGSHTELGGADFVGADVSGASFQSADVSGAAFNGVRAVGTDFNSVVAENTVFSDAHVYGDGRAFEAANDLRGADFSGAVLAANVGEAGGFDFTAADLTGAKFDGTQCISCNFTGAKLARVSFSKAYLPGTVLAGATVTGIVLTDAWLYCGDLNDSLCKKAPSSQPSWPLALGSQEAYGPVPFTSTNLTGISLSDVAVCPDGKAGATYPAGCGNSHLLPNTTLTLPAPCSSTALDACPTLTKTLFDAASIGSPRAVEPVAPPTWATTASGRGYYVGLDDSTIRLAGYDGQPKDNQVVAGTHGETCPGSTDPCGDDGPAIHALLGTPAALAVGLDGALYVADPRLHRVRRIDGLTQHAQCPAPSSRASRLRRTSARHRRTAVRRRRPATRQQASKRCRGRRCVRKPKTSCGSRSPRSRSAVTVSPGRITTVAGTGKACGTAGAACGDGGPATSAALAGPYGMWVGPSGLVFIADGRRGIREVRPDGTIVTIADAGGTYDIRSVAGGSTGNLYATTRDYVLEVDPAGGKITPVVGTGISGYNGNTDPNFGTLLPGDQVQINHPLGASIALNDNVVFTDTDNSLLRAYVPSSDHVTDPLAGVVANGVPQAGYNGDGLFAGQTKVDHPEAVAVTRGPLFVLADTHNQRVRQFGPSPLLQRRPSRPRPGRRSRRGAAQSAPKSSRG